MNRARVLAALQKPSKSSLVNQSRPIAPSNEPRDTIEEPSKPVNDLTRNGQACPQVVGSEKEEDVLQSFDLWDPMGEDFFSTDNTLELNPDREPECVVTGQMTDEYSMVGKYRVCDFYLKYGTCADGEYCNRLHIEPKARETLRAIQDSTVMKTSKTCLFYHNLMPSDLNLIPGSLILVSLTFIEAPNKFRLIAPYEQMNFADFNEDEIQFYASRVQHSSPFKTKLEKCHEQLALLFDHNYRVDNIKDSIFLDQIVACKLDDGRFYRGAIVEKLDTDEFKVALIDTGKKAILSRMDIYSIRAKCLNDAPLSIMASLRVKPPNGQLHWSQEALQTFRSATLDQKYMLCRFLSLEMEDLHTVDLLDMSSRLSLTDRLVSDGLAEPTFA